MFGERLYTLSSRDVQARYLDTLLRRADVESVGVALEPQFLVPADRVLVLKALALEADANGGDTVTGLALLLRSVTDPLNPVRLRQDALVGPVNGQRFMDWQGEIIVPAGVAVVGFASFSTGVPVNFAFLSIAGMLIPIGNVERL